MAAANRTPGQLGGRLLSGDVPEAVLDAHRASKDKPEPTALTGGVLIRKGAATASAAA